MVITLAINRHFFAFGCSFSKVRPLEWTVLFADEGSGRGYRCCRASWPCSVSPLSRWVLAHWPKVSGMATFLCGFARRLLSREKKLNLWKRRKSHELRPLALHCPFFQRCWGQSSQHEGNQPRGWEENRVQDWGGELL